MKSVGYDSNTETLEIEFSSGRIYEYRSVEASVHAWLIRSKDKGGLFNRLIRDRYEEAEVTPAPPEENLAELLQRSLRPKTEG